MKSFDLAHLPNVVERIVDSALFRPALMLFEIGLQLGFSLIRINDKFLPGSKRELANIAIRSVRSAPDEANDSELAAGHGDMMAVRSCGVKLVFKKLGPELSSACGGVVSLETITPD